MKLSETSIDGKYGADEAWDAIQDWLYTYNLELGIKDRCNLYTAIRDVLENADLKEVQTKSHD